MGLLVLPPLLSLFVLAHLSLIAQVEFVILKVQSDLFMARSLSLIMLALEQQFWL